MENRQKGTKTLIIILTMLIMLPTGLLVGMKGFTAGMNILTIYVMLLVSMLIAVVLQTAIHEAGHMVFGLLTGYRFLSYRVLSFFVSREDGKLKAGKLAIPGTMGQCLMATPLDKSRRPYFLYNAGGVIFNIIFAIINYLICFSTSSAIIGILAAINGAYDLIMAVSNGIPFRGNGVANDGCNIREMHDHPKTIDTFYNMLDLNEMLLKGRRSADIPDSMMDLNETTLYSGATGSANIMWKENKLMDEHRFTEARELIKQIYEKQYPLIDYHWKMLLLDQKYLDCLDGTFEDITDKKTVKFLEGSRKSVLSVIRYFYVRALYLKDEEEINKNRQAFAAMEKDYPYAGEYQSEKELMEIAEERLRKQENEE